MTKTMKALLPLLLAGAVAACSVEGKNDYGSYYQKQASLDVLKMPPGVSAQGADNYYVVPPGPMADVKTVSILPPGSRAYQSAIDKNIKNGKTLTAKPPVVATTPVTTPVANDNTAVNTTAEPAKQ